MKPRRVPIALLVMLLLLLAKAGCSRKAGTERGAPLTPTKGHGYTPLPLPPTLTFVPGRPTPPPELPG